MFAQWALQAEDCVSFHKIGLQGAAENMLNLLALNETSCTGRVCGSPLATQQMHPETTKEGNCSATDAQAGVGDGLVVVPRRSTLGTHWAVVGCSVLTMLTHCRERLCIASATPCSLPNLSAGGGCRFQSGPKAGHLRPSHLIQKRFLPQLPQGGIWLACFAGNIEKPCPFREMRRHWGPHRYQDLVTSSPQEPLLTLAAAAVV
mmetsp:Transcript_19560/g.36660  ORF Transcript_19560/g.36660 Transcript_19560/m.36660 type:complete len:204 (+) Transcript_19560:927-1538(+)